MENGTSQVNDDHEDEVGELLGTHLVTADNEHRVVEADEVEEQLLVTGIVPFPVIVITVEEIVRGDPRLVPVIFLRELVGALNSEEPEAGDHMEVDDEENVVVEHLKHTLGALLHVGLGNQGGDSEDTVHLEDTDYGCIYN